MPDQQELNLPRVRTPRPQRVDLHNQIVDALLDKLKTRWPDARRSAAEVVYDYDYADGYELAKELEDNGYYGLGLDDASFLDGMSWVSPRVVDDAQEKWWARQPDDDRNRIQVGDVVRFPFREEHHTGEVYDIDLTGRACVRCIELGHVPSWQFGIQDIYIPVEKLERCVRVVLTEDDAKAWADIAPEEYEPSAEHLVRLSEACSRGLPTNPTSEEP